MIDRKWIGHGLPPSEILVERGRLRFFAQAIGETDPVCTDVAAARDAGHADLPAPPSFLFAAAEMLGVNPGLTDAGLTDAMERIIPPGRGGTSDEAAGAVHLFCIPESECVSRQTLVCSGDLGGF